MPTATDLVTDLPADFEVFGQAVATSMADLLGGTTGQILAKASNTNMDFTWVTNDVGDITAVTATTPLTGGGTSGAITVGIQDATTSVKGAVQLSDSTSTTSSILAATPTAVKSAYDLATTANTNSNNITMVQQYTATESVLKNIPSRIPAGEQLLKQAVYWIDAAQSDNSDQILDNQGWGAPSLTTQLGSSASADSNDPKFLDFDGSNYVYLPGATTNNLSVPDSNDLDIAGDIEIVVRVAADDWTPASTGVLIAKDNSGAQRSWTLDLTNGGLLRWISWNSAGTLAVNVSSSIVVPFTDGVSYWVKVTLDVDNGASGNDVKFWYAADQATEPTSWTQLGTTQTTAGTTSLFNSTISVVIGDRAAASTPIAGKYRKAIIRNSIDGTKVLDVDTSVIGSGSATTFSALTGQTVTINRSTTGKKTSVVTAPLWLFGTDDYMAVSDNDLIDFDATQDFTLFAVTRTFTSAGSGNRAILAKQVSAANQAGYVLINNMRQTNIQIRDSSTLVQDSSGTGIADGSLMISTGVVSRSTTTETAYDGTATNGGASISTVTGSLSNALSFVIGRYSNETNSDMEFVAAAIFRRALTASEVSTLTNYYTARVGA
jgi:TolB-like protein